MDGPHQNSYCNPDVLMRMVQGGSPAALDRITRCYGQRLLEAGSRYCRTRAEAEDAVQDTMLLAATRLSDLRGEGTLEGWLVRIVASACRRMSRGVPTFLFYAAGQEIGRHAGFRGARQLRDWIADQHKSRG